MGVYSRATPCGWPAPGGLLVGDLPLNPGASLSLDPGASLPLDPGASLPLDPGALLPLGPARCCRSAHIRIHSCLFFLLFRTRAGFELEADGGAFEAEGFAQAVLQVTLVGKVDGCGVVDEEDEGGRVHCRLRRIVNL
jgi:hypothetical protein